MKRLFLPLMLIASTPILAMQDNEKNDLKEMLLVAAANGKASWIHTLTGFHGAKELVDSAVNEQGATPLLIACQKGHADVVAVLQAEGADGTKPLEIKTPDGAIIPCTALHMAAGCGHADIVKLLLESLPESDRCKINSNCAPKGRTPLHCATFSQKWDAAKVLLQYGADRNQKDDDGITPSKRAKWECDYIYYKLFNEAPSLKGYAISKNIAGLKELLKAGESLDLQEDEYGRTALFYAIEYLFPEGVEALINAGADVSVQDDCNWSPLELIEQIEETHGPSPEITKIRNLLEQAMEHAVENRTANKPMALQEKNEADIQAKDKEDFDPFAHAEIDHFTFYQGPGLTPFETLDDLRLEKYKTTSKNRHSNE